jgi:tRNA pseudouridine55 synthase
LTRPVYVGILDLAITMPKTTIPPLPLQGIFALAKPSGPTTMSLITRLKPLFSASKLFVEQEKLGASTSLKQKTMKNAYPGPTLPGELTGKDRNKGKGKGKRTNWKKLSQQYVKMGSGGTLDPLADGVLSESWDTLLFGF